MTKSATKVRKANTLIDILENLTASKTLDEMATRRLAREARALMDSDASGAHTVLGGIASLEGNAAKVHEHYETAVRLSSQRNPTLANYATALTNIGEMDEAFRTILKAHEAAPDDLEFLDAAIGIAGEGAKFCQIRVLDERRKKLRPNERKNEETCTRAAEAIDRGAFTERGAQEVARIAHQMGVAPKLIIINELWDDAWARHLWDRTPVFDTFARGETTRDRIGGFGRASAASEWLARHAAPIACRSV